ncbi:MAG: hypothetical protein N2689_12300 [Verrucomicrobiae bacterium]|nr:hypothetical protein [Verrucomicrobiae bacterium]
MHCIFNEHLNGALACTGLTKFVFPALILCAMAVSVPVQRCSAANFGDDLAFLQKYTEVIILADKAAQAKVALAPAWQGRVMTSTATGDAGLSFGWINRELIASRKLQQHINVFGGEDRFWMGPEGGQFSIFFAQGVPFDLQHWFTPAAIDTEPYKVVGQSADKARFTHTFALVNYCGTKFDVRVDREVRLLTAAAAWKRLRVKPAAGVSMVAFESANKITNVGNRAWRKETGLLSVWILSMLNPSPDTTIVVPIKPGPVEKLGKVVTADYFGQVPPERLVVRDTVIFFSGDGQYRSKIGVGPRRSKAILGSYDAANKVLTLAQFTQPAGATDYVNSLWKLQDDPYAGDAVNSYNDGPPAPGAKPLGPFYELESSSPAAALAPGKSLEHIHRTIHLSGPEADLDAIARATLGVSLREIATALPKAGR